MAYFSNLNQSDKAKALGSGRADASNGILFSKVGEKRPLQLVQQFLIIGVGGSGTQTVDRIKGELSRQYSWTSDHLAFLAIDTDDDGMKTLLNLDLNEKYLIEDAPNIEDRHNIPANRTEFTKEWIHPHFHENFSTGGANQIRPVCHAKMFDEGGRDSADQKLIESIQTAANPFVTASSTEVIVILGVSGGTGSGGIINIAHFVREALKTKGKINVTGYFYMPDVFRYPEYSTSKKSNGYAALKELDYYYCARQRSVPEFLKSHAPEPLRVDQDNLLYDTTFLVSGSVGGAIAAPYNTAIGAVKESIVNILTENQTAIAAAAATDGTGKQPVFMMSQFKTNSDTERNNVLAHGFGTDANGLPNGTEKIDFYGDDVYNYNAIGVGSISVPREIIKCFAVDQVVHKVLAFTGAADAAVAGAKWSNPPFSAADGENKIGLLLTLTPEKVEEKIKDTCKFNHEYDSATINKGTIMSGTAATDLKTGVGLNNPNKVKDDFLRAIKREIDDAYSVFEGKLTNFLKNNGPKAFKHLYKGAGSDKNYRGIENKLDDYRIYTRDDGKLQPNAEKALNDAKQALHKIWGGQGKAAKSHTWAEAYLSNEATIIAYEISNGIYGPGKYYDTGYLSKVRTLCEECCEFAEVLDGLTKTYNNLSYYFSDYTRYSQWLKNHALGSVYDCIRSEAEYNWAKSEVDQQLNAVNYETIRNDLVDDFMKDRNQWICYEEGKYIPRKAFDAFIGPNVTFTDEMITVVNYIHYKVAGGTNLNTVATELVNALDQKSVPLFNKETGIATVDMTAGTNRYLLVPEGIFNGTEGMLVKQAFKTACNNKRPQISMQESAGVDNFVLFTQKGGLPIFAVAELKDWEFEYNRDLRRLHRNESGDGDFNPATGLEWKNYPYLSHERNPRTSNVKGHISAEGKFLVDKLDPLWKEAVEIGLIQEKTDPNGNYYYEYYNLIHRPGWNLAFNVNTWSKDANGLLAEGRDMFDHFAKQNGKTLADITKVIRLEDQGAFSNPNPNRDNALDWAKRSLRKNVPMYREVKQTVAKVKDIVLQIKAENAIIKDNIEKAAAWDKACTLVPRLIACEILSEVNTASAQWSLLNDKGKGLAIGYLIVRNIEGDDLVNRARCNNGLLYPALVGQFCRFMKEHSAGDLAPFENDCDVAWNDMQADSRNGDTEMTERFKAQLKDFADEAKSFMDTYNVPTSKKVREALMKNLDASDDYDQLLECYCAVYDEWNNL